MSRRAGAEAGRPRGLLVFFLLTLRVPGMAAGQTAPPPPGATGGAGVPAVPSWTLSVGVEQSWNSNPRFRSPDDPGDSLDRFAATLSRHWVRPQTEVTFSAEGSGLVYRQLDSLDAFDYSGGLELTHRLSRQATASLRESVSSRYSIEQQALTADGLLLPLSRSLANRASVTLDYRFSQRTTGLVSVGHDLVRFDSTSLVDGSTLTANGSLRRRLSRTGALGLAYTYARSNAQTLAHIHTLAATLGASLGRHVVVDGALGLSQIRSPGVEPSGATPTGGAGLLARWRRHLAGARYTRSANQAFGLGRQRVSSVVSASLASTPVGRLALDANYSRGLSTDPQDSAFRLTSDAVAVDLRHPLWRRIEVAGGYSYRRSDSEGARPVTARIYRIALAYRQEWGGASGPPPGKVAPSVFGLAGAE